MSTDRPPLLTPTNIRLHPKMRTRLQTLAARHGIRTSDLVRNAIAAKLPEWESSGIRLSPVNPPRDRNQP